MSRPRRQSWPQLLDYWRWEGRLFQIKGRDPRDNGHYLLWLVSVTGESYETEVIDFRLHEDGELVYSPHPKPDERLGRLTEYAEAVRELARLANTIHILGAEHPVPMVERAIRNDAKIIEDLARPMLLAIEGVSSPIRQRRRQLQDDAGRALNDEMGLPNCDHLLPDPNCAECAKVRA